MYTSVEAQSAWSSRVQFVVRTHRKDISKYECSELKELSYPNMKIIAIQELNIES